jgi:hypothetical protein
LRIFFAACASTDGGDLDHEKEEEAILRMVDRLGQKGSSQNLFQIVR